MAKIHEGLLEWNDWLARDPLGQYLLERESEHLRQYFDGRLFQHAVLIGVPSQACLMNHSAISNYLLVANCPHGSGSNGVLADYQELPIMTGQVDLVLLPHTLEWVAHPRQLLAEACRITKPTGLMVVLGFNPLRKRSSLAPFRIKEWQGFSARELRKWLQLADFIIDRQQSFLYSPLNWSPRSHQSWLEVMGHYLLPRLGCVYSLAAHMQQIPLTPVRFAWKPSLYTSMPTRVAERKC